MEGKMERRKGGDGGEAVRGRETKMERERKRGRQKEWEI